MTAITQAVSVQGAQIRSGFVRFARGIGEVFTTLDAAIRLSSAIEMRQAPNPADLQVLGITGPLPRLY